jgi:hypothetical protein
VLLEVLQETIAPGPEAIARLRTSSIKGFSAKRQRTVNEHASGTKSAALVSKRAEG